MSLLEFESPAWVRQPVDTDERAFRAFQAYLAAGPSRTLNMIATDFGVAFGVVVSWAQDADWDARCQEYDEHLRTTAEAARDATVMTLADLRTKAARLALEYASGELAKHVAQSKERDRPLGSVRDAIRAMRDGASISRLEEGLATEQVAVQGNPHRFDHLSDDELAKLRFG